MSKGRHFDLEALSVEEASSSLAASNSQHALETSPFIKSYASVMC